MVNLGYVAVSAGNLANPGAGVLEERVTGLWEGEELAGMLVGGAHTVGLARGRAAGSTLAGGFGGDRAGGRYI